MSKLEKILIGIMTLMGFLLVLSYITAQKEKDLRKEAQNNLKLEKEKPTYMKGDSSVAKIEVQTASDTKTAKILLGDEPIIKELGLKISSLQYFIKANFKAQGIVHDTVTEVLVDSFVRYRTFNPSDQYLKLFCKDSAGIVTCPYSYSDTATAITFLEGPTWYIPWTWFKKKKVSTIVTLGNSKAVIQDVKSVIRKR
jgi:hypothetical protein